MASIKRDIKVAERRRDVAEMYLGGFTQAEIAHKWRVSQQQISQDLKYIHAAWLQAATMDFDRLKARELARINRLEREYWRAWSESRGTHEKTVTTKSEGEGAYTKAQIEREQSAGDPRYLAGVQWCIEQRLKVFGVYAAQKLDLTWRELAEREGIDAGAAFEAMVQHYAVITSGANEPGGDSGSEAPDGGSQDHAVSS